MGLYRIQNTEITGNGFPNTDILSVQTGNPWNYTVWTPNGEPIITEFNKEVTDQDKFFGGMWEDAFFPMSTFAVSNNFWADLTPETKPEDLTDSVNSFTQLLRAVGRYHSLLENRFKCANVGHDDYTWYPIVIYIENLQTEIRFCLEALLKAQNCLTSEAFKEKLAKVDTSKFTGPTCKDKINYLNNMIGVGGFTSIIPGVGGEWGVPLINEEGIDGKDVPAIWNAFLAQIDFDGLGFDLRWDENYGLVWEGITPTWEGQNWPIAW